MARLNPLQKKALVFHMSKVEVFQYNTLGKGEIAPYEQFVLFP